MVKVALDGRYTRKQVPLTDVLSNSILPPTASHDALHDGEAQAKPMFCHIAGIGREKRLEDSCPSFGGDAMPMVADRNPNVILIGVLSARYSQTLLGGMH